MSKVVFNAEILQLMTFFESLTKTKVKDCIIGENQIIFVVYEGMASKAIGKKGANVKLLQSKFNRKIKIVEFNTSLLKFVQNIILPLKVDEIAEEDDIVYLKSNDVNIKSMLIGRNASNLRNMESVVRRYFSSLKEIKVI